MKTMKTKITKLQTICGFCAEKAATLFIIGACVAGISVSTTRYDDRRHRGHRIDKQLSAVRWGVAGTFIWAWVLTIPISGVLFVGIHLLLAAMVEQPHLNTISRS